MHMEHTAVTHETGLNWPRNSGEMYLITAPNATTNKWGEVRSYRILPGTGMGNPVHLTIENSTALSASAAWSTSDLWILRNHPDTEPAAAHHLNYLSPGTPLVDFAAMVDGEAIEEEDLVVYFNLGGHHVPSSQDVPNTLMHTSASSVLFMPFNYFDDDVSRYVRQGVRIDRRRQSGAEEKKTEKDEIRRSSRPKTHSTDRELEGEADGITYFGARYTSPVTVPLHALSPDLSHYMKERDDGEGEHWKTVRNHVGGGLLGLFVGKERIEDRDRDGDGDGKGGGNKGDSGRRFDW